MAIMRFFPITSCKKNTDNIDMKKTEEKLNVCISTKWTCLRDKKNRVIAQIPKAALIKCKWYWLISDNFKLYFHNMNNTGNNAKKFLKKTTSNKGIRSAKNLIHVPINTKKSTDNDLNKNADITYKSNIFRYVWIY